jgi:hypothetical protein
MAKHISKGKGNNADAGRSRRFKVEEPEAGVREEEDEEAAEAEFSVVADTRVPHEPDPREVDNLTERIFRSVLSRYGWERHGDRIEHVGGSQMRDRQR